MTDAHRIRSDDTWAAARDDYLAGATGEQVCARYDLGDSAFRKRAREEGWRRCDQADPDPLPDDLDDPDDLPPADVPELADLALRRMAEAVRKGRSAEALRWQRLHQSLSTRLDAEDEAKDTARHEAAAQAKAKAFDATLPPGLSPPDRVKARLDALLSGEWDAFDPPEVQEIHKVHPVFDTPAGQAVLTRAERRRQLRAARKRS